MREKQDYRNNLEAIMQTYPGKMTLTVSEVADYLDIRRQTVSHIIEEGDLAAANVGTGKNKIYRVTPQSLARFLS